MPILLLLLLAVPPVQAKAAGAPDAPAAQIAALSPEQCRKMAEIPAGEFLFGDLSTVGRPVPGRRPATARTNAFLMDKCETTERQYRAYYYMATGKKTFSRLHADQLDAPTLGHSYEEAGAYCKTLGKRLPTEEEWEKAARGGTRTNYYWGDEWPGDDNGYEWNIDKFANRSYYFPVGGKAPNPYGLYDMLGNAREMTTGNYDKGGSIKLGKFNAACGKQYAKAASGRMGDLGWRCVKDVKTQNPQQAAKN